jgi:hypothetical protein
MNSNQIIELEGKYEKINKQKRMIKEKMYELENEQKKIEEEIEKLKEELYIPKIIEDVKKIDINNILSDGEILKIYQGMDKSDYSDVGKNCWLDLDKLINSTIRVKNKYQSMNFILVNVKLGMREDRYPPTNYYTLNFEDSEGIRFISSC